MESEGTLIACFKNTQRPTDIDISKDKSLKKSLKYNCYPYVNALGFLTNLLSNPESQTWNTKGQRRTPLCLGENKILPTLLVELYKPLSAQMLL